MSDMDISSIRIEGRHRKDMGDIKALAASIAEVGLLHPVVVTPDGRLIAGQRRIEAVKTLGWQAVPVTVIDLQSIVRGEYAENVDRKDFAPSEAVAIGREREPIEREAAKRRSGTRTDLEPGVKFTGGEALDLVANTVGMSRATYNKARAVVEAAEADPDKFGAIAERMDRTGKITHAFQEMLKKQYATKEQPSMPVAKYRVIYADPPWAYGNNMPDSYGVQDNHYPTMTMKQLCDLPIRELSEDNAVLFLWVTSPILFDSLDLIKAWGFKYKASFVWDKVKHVMGHYNSVRHEMLLICVKGSCQPDVHKLYDSVITEERTEHSRKPQVFREIIDTIYPNGKRIELFARGKIANWDSYGNDI